MHQLTRILQEDILPLLEEYCYDNWDTLEQILGKRFVDVNDKRFRTDLLAPDRQDDLVLAMLEPDPTISASAIAVAAEAAVELDLIQRTKTKMMRRHDPPVVKLTEWDTRTPAQDAALRDLSLPTDRRTRELMGRLADAGMLTLRELASGLEIETTSFVGSVALGPVTVRIQPKLGARPLSCLLGYALGLHDRGLDLFSEHDVPVAPPAFQDILAHHLCSEVARLIERGLYRQYTVNESDLARPRGRVLFGRMVRQGGRAVTALPCRYHERDDNALPNRVVLSGLRFAARICVHNTIRIRALRLAGQLALTVNPVQLSAPTFAAVRRASNRLTASYAPALALIRLLVAGHGVTDAVGGRGYPVAWIHVRHEPAVSRSTGTLSARLAGRWRRPPTIFLE